MKSREIMTFHPEALLPDETVGDAARVMRELDVGAMPVVQDRESMRLVGIVALADVAPTG